MDNVANNNQSNAAVNQPQAEQRDEQIQQIGSRLLEAVSQNQISVLARAASFASVRSESLLSLTGSQASLEVMPVYTRQFARFLIESVQADNENISVNDINQIIDFFTDTRNCVQNVSAGIVTEMIFAQIPSEQVNEFPQAMNAFLRHRLLSRQVVRFFYHNQLFNNRASEFTQNLRDEILQTPNYRNVLYSSIRRELEYTDNAVIRQYLQANDPVILVDNLENSRAAVDQVLGVVDLGDFEDQ